MPQWIRVIAALAVAFCAAAILISPAVDLPDFTTAVKVASAASHANAIVLHLAVSVSQPVQHFGAVLVDFRHRPTLPLRFAPLFILTCARLC